MPRLLGLEIGKAPREVASLDVLDRGASPSGPDGAAIAESSSARWKPRSTGHGRTVDVVFQETTAYLKDAYGDACGTRGDMPWLKLSQDEVPARDLSVFWFGHSPESRGGDPELGATCGLPPLRRNALVLSMTERSGCIVFLQASRITACDNLTYASKGEMTRMW